MIWGDFHGEGKLGVLCKIIYLRAVVPWGVDSVYRSDPNWASADRAQGSFCMGKPQLGNSVGRNQRWNQTGYCLWFSFHLLTMDDVSCSPLLTWHWEMFFDKLLKHLFFKEIWACSLCKSGFQICQMWKNMSLLEILEVRFLSAFSSVYRLQFVTIAWSYCRSSEILEPSFTGYWKSLIWG